MTYLTWRLPVIAMVTEHAFAREFLALEAGFHSTPASALLLARATPNVNARIFVFYQSEVHFKGLWLVLNGSLFEIAFTRMAVYCRNVAVQPFQAPLVTRKFRNAKASAIGQNRCVMFFLSPVFRSSRDYRSARHLGLVYRDRRGLMAYLFPCTIDSTK